VLHWQQRDAWVSAWVSGLVGRGLGIRDGAEDPRRQYVVLSSWYCPLLFSKHGGIHKQTATGQCLMPTPYLKPIRAYVQYCKGRRAPRRLQS
jgi:hypothetical protein